MPISARTRSSYEAHARSKRPITGRWALNVGAAAALLAGCGGSQPPIGALGAMPYTATQPQLRQDAQKYRVLFNFGSNAYGLDGVGPVAPLINVHGTFYDTTEYGGAYDGGGTVFSVSMAGINERVLYSFRGNGPSVGGPAGGLIEVNGLLYGTTTTDGIYGGGTVFRVSTRGTSYRVLHNFGRGSDGAQPRAGMITINDKLYGTTYQGGSACSGSGGCGTVFRISTGGKEDVIYNFSGKSDGGYPMAALIDENGMLYGTTEFGGSNGGGTVFRVTTRGNERVLYSFSGPDGNHPVAGVIALNGALYGTTINGGSADGGTVFSMSVTGANERVLHSFGTGTDGSQPQAGLTALSGRLYGTTYIGGSAASGTVFSVTRAGKERVLHSFGEGYANDGLNPLAGLIDVKGTLYGTTFQGGVSLPSCPRTAGYCDYGTVFALTP